MKSFDSVQNHQFFLCIESNLSMNVSVILSTQKGINLLLLLSNEVRDMKKANVREYMERFSKPLSS